MFPRLGSNLWVQVILLPQSPEKQGLQAHATVPGFTAALSVYKFVGLDTSKENIL